MKGNDFSLIEYKIDCLISETKDIIFENFGIDATSIMHRSFPKKDGGNEVCRIFLNHENIAKKIGACSILNQLKEKIVDLIKLKDDKFQGGGIYPGEFHDKFNEDGSITFGKTEAIKPTLSLGTGLGDIGFKPKNPEKLVYISVDGGNTLKKVV